MSSNNTPLSPRLERLLGYLEADKNNLNLLSDAAEAALEERQPALARNLLQDHASVAPLPSKALNLAGLAAMQLNEWDEAVSIFSALIAREGEAPGLAFNLAWSLAMKQEFDAALTLLTPSIVQALPQAAALHVQLLHQKGLLDETIAAGREHLARFPDYAPLAAAVSVAAIDAEDLTLAATCANAAPGHPDALTTLGVLALQEDRTDEAAKLFDQAVRLSPNAPRAQIGVGMGHLLNGKYSDAAQEIERGAATFGTHIGSWIAAGWAHLLGNDLGQARRCFETALEIDPAFSETHGSLAVLLLLEDRRDEARKEAQTARRLDANSFSTALANAMLASSRGDAESARTILQRALTTPIDSSGRTIAQSLARRGFTS